MEQVKKELNHFLVNAFNEILKTEEVLLAGANEFPNLSLREIHVIEAVCNAEDDRTENHSTAIAAILRITAGTLTTTVSLLEKKGYLIRKKTEKDKRMVQIFPTELGRKAHDYHRRFHEEMVECILSILSKKEIDVLVDVLGKISSFFHNKYLTTR